MEQHILSTHGCHWSPSNTYSTGVMQDKWADEHRWKRGGSRDWHPTDLASSWPLQRALSRLQDNPPLPHSVPHQPSSTSPSLSSSLCPRIGLYPDNQSHWWLCFQLSQPLFLLHHITSSLSVGNIQESRPDEPKEMFWEKASPAKSNWDHLYTGCELGKKYWEWCCRVFKIQSYLQACIKVSTSGFCFCAELKASVFFVVLCCKVIVLVIL